MYLTINITFLLILSITFATILGQSSNNLSCYQCIRNSEVECEPHELRSCPSVSDRCVTHISRSAERGFTVKRECGLGPCGFDDEMVNRGLGLGKCDQNRKDFFCIFCCRESGCNKNNSGSRHVPSLLFVLSIVFFSK